MGNIWELILKKQNIEALDRKAWKLLNELVSTLEEIYHVNMVNEAHDYDYDIMLEELSESIDNLGE